MLSAADSQEAGSPLRTISICGGFLLLFVISSPASAKPSQSQIATHNQAVEFNNRGLELYKAGKIDEAIKQFRQALAIDPDFPEADSNLGLALADYPGFRQEGFEIAALFDAAHEKIGHESRAAFLHAGGEALHACPCLNDHPAWIEALGRIVMEQGWL